MNRKNTKPLSTIAEADTADLLKKIAIHEKVLAELVAEVKTHVAVQRAAAADPSECDARGALVKRMDRAEPERWAALGRTNIQQGLMFLTRAVAQPEF